MQNLGTYFLWALAACILFDGSFAKDQSGYVCLIDKPNPNCCDNFPSNSRDAGIQAKLDGVADQQARLEGRLQGVEAKLEGRLQGVEAKLERQLQEVQTKLEAKLGESLLAVQEKIENQLQAVVNQLQAVSNKIDAAKVETQVHPISNKTDAPQQAVKAGVPASDTITIPSGFELIGTRYFRIVKEDADWYTAKRRCREMGGYLASFRNEEEFNAITPKLGIYFFWTGINDHNKEGHFVSVASHKPAPFLKWEEGEPDDGNHKLNCVFLNSGKMSDAYCNGPIYFICQADNET